MKVKCSPPANGDPWIQTFSGRKPSLICPTYEDIHIDDIAHALSNIARFTGHTRSFYSVAQHCVIGAGQVVTEYKDKTLAKLFLLHDAPEAYLGDMSKPVKRLLRIEPDEPGIYDLYEKRWSGIIYRKFGYTEEQVLQHKPKINEIDMRMLFTERNQLLPMFDTKDWNSLGEYEPFAYSINPWSPATAKKAFLNAYENLWKE
jgi:5'-deoxynucleotidase YfbR-like HD superfamily hydrolase